MTLTTVQLWERLASSGLANTEECRCWALAVAEKSPNDLHDANRLLVQLIQLGKLTPFQANVLVRNLSIPLTIGQFRVTQSLEKEIGRSWFAATDSQSKQPRSRWLFLLTPEFLSQSQVRHHPPSLQLSKKYVGLQHPALDQWQFIDTIGDHIAAVCHAIHGKSLNKILAERTMSMEEASAMISNIASGLAQIHDQGLVHGNISGSSVWQHLNQAYVLRTDPLFPPTNPYVIASGDITNWDENPKLAFAAPEFTLPGWQPTPQTDLYALGCLWYQSVTGNMLFGESIHSDGTVWSKRHCLEPVPNLRELTSNEDLARCLAHLLAKNPDARFPTCDSLIRAIDNSLPSPVPVVGKKSKPDKASLVFAVLDKPKPEPLIEANIQDALSKRGPVTNSPPAVAGQSSTEAVPKSKAVPVTSAQYSRSSSKRKKHQWVFPTIIVSALGLFAIVLGILLRNGTSQSTANTDKTDGLVKQSDSTSAVTQSNVSTSTEEKLAVAGNYFSVVPDDGKLLFSPRYYGSPCSIEWMPAGLEAIAFISRDNWKQNGPWTRINKWWSEVNPDIQTVFANFPLLEDENVESIAIGLYPSERSDEFQIVKRIQFEKPVPISSMAGHLNRYRLDKFESGKSNQGIWIRSNEEEPMACAMQGLQTSPEAHVKWMVLGPLELIKSLKDQENGFAPIQRPLEILLESTDQRNDLTVLFSARFMRGDGKQMLRGVPGAETVMSDMLGNQVVAVSMTTDLDSNWFSEFRLTLEDSRDNAKWTAQLRQRVEQFANSFESQLVGGTTSPYWRSIALRYPQMLRGLSRYLRIGIEENQVVGNVYLPTEAANNLIIASWMSLREPMSSTSADSNPTTTSPNVTPQKSIEDILNTPINVAFEQESLETALSLIASEVSESVLGGKSIPFVINYDAFKKDGITQNQQIRDFKKTSVTLRGVLTDLVRRANPITTVQSTTENDQKVIWVIQNSEEGLLKKRVELTTRSWANAKNTAMPPEFANP